MGTQSIQHFRMNRYPLDYPAFDGKILEAGNFIELNPNDSLCGLPDIQVCHAPQSPVSTLVDTFSATLLWTGTPGVQGYSVRHRELGYNFWMDNTVNAPTTQLNLSNLIPGISYEWQVYAICDSTHPSNSMYSILDTFQTLSGDSTTGFSLNEPYISIHPNPAKNTLQIETSGLAGSRHIKIIHSNGVEIYSEQTSLNHVQIELNKWPSGFYFIVIETEGARVFKKLMVE